MVTGVAERWQVAGGYGVFISFKIKTGLVDLPERATMGSDGCVKL